MIKRGVQRLISTQKRRFNPIPLATRLIHTNNSPVFQKQRKERFSTFINHHEEAAKTHADLGRELFLSFATIRPNESEPTLGLPELDLLMHSLGYHRSLETMEHLLFRVDTNHDGKVDLQEFLEAFDWLVAQRITRRDIRVLFNRIDKDGSGTIEVEELAGMLLTTGGAITKEEAEDIMNHVDTDGDGRIDLHEFEKYILDHPGSGWKFFSGYRTAFLLGPPCAGKGVYCAQLTTIKGINHVSTGDLCRQEIAKSTALGVKIQEIVSKGELIPSVTIVALLKKFLTYQSAGKFTLIDGFPRTQENFDDFQNHLGLPHCFINLECPDDVVIDRIVKRGMQSGRADDTREVAAQRLHDFHEKTEPLLVELRKHQIREISIDSTKNILVNVGQIAGVLTTEFLHG